MTKEEEDKIYHDLVDGGYEEKRCLMRWKSQEILKLSVITLLKIELLMIL